MVRGRFGYESRRTWVAYNHFGDPNPVDIQLIDDRLWWALVRLLKLARKVFKVGATEARRALSADEIGVFQQPRKPSRVTRAAATSRRLSLQLRVTHRASAFLQPPCFTCTTRRETQHSREGRAT